MKKILLVLISFTVLIQLSAQVKEGTISYEKKRVSKRRSTDESGNAATPQYRITHHTLLFNDTVSLFKTIKEDDEAINPFDGGGEGRSSGNGSRGGGFGGGGGFGSGGRFSRMMGSADGDLYKSFVDGMLTQSIEIAGKNFLVTDTIRKQPWKITEETKVILGYTCHKATLKQKGIFGGYGGGNWGGSTRNRGEGDRPNGEIATPDTTHRTPRELDVVAWFADKIVAPVGPDTYGQLPGAILEVNIDNAQTVITATEVKATFAAKDLKEPKKGKKLTREEFRNMINELRKNFSNAAPDAGN